MTATRFLFVLCFLLARHADAAGLVGSSPAPSITTKVRYVNAGANLYAVKTQSVAGTTIIVGPGLYSLGVTNLLKNGVNWFFYPGAVVSNGVSGPVGGIFDNSVQGTSGSITCNIAGFATFIDLSGGSDGATYSGMLHLSDAGSRVKFQCRSLQNRSVAGSAVTYAAIMVDDCSLLELDVDSVSSVSGTLNVFWFNGTARGRIGSITGFSEAALWCEGTGPADWILDVGTMSTPSASSVYFAPTHADNKLWVRNIWTYGGSAGGLNYGAAITVYGGKFYFETQKLWGNWGGVSDPGSIIFQSGGQSWVKTLKMAITNSQTFVEQTGGYLRVDCMDWEDNLVAGGTRPYCNILSGGTNVLFGGRALTKWGPFYKLTGGQVHLEKMTVDTLTTIAPSNSCLWAVGAGPVPVVKDCVFIPGGHFSVTNASAADIRIFGYLHTRSNLTVTLTQRGGAATVSQYFDR